MAKGPKRQRTAAAVAVMSSSVPAAAVDAAGAAAAATTKPTPPPPPPPAPLRTIVLDNGGDTIKYGWSTDPLPQQMPNLTGRLPQQYWSVLVGDQITTSLQNPNTAVLMRSMERFVIHNLGNQVQVWKRIFDKMGVAINPTSGQHQQLGEVFGWTTTNTPADAATPAAAAATATASTTIIVPANQCAILIGLPIFMPRIILEQLLSIFWHEFGIPHVGFYISGAAAAQPTTFCSNILVHPQTTNHLDETTATTTLEKEENEQTTRPDFAMVPIACVVDMGWSGCTVLPVYQDKVIMTTNHNNGNNGPEPKPIVKRLGLGGRHMIQMLKYHLTYRQYNLMEQEFVLRHVFEQTALISLEYENDIRAAATASNKHRPLYDLDYLLPDYETTKVGLVQVPPSVQQQLDRIAQNNNKAIGEEEESNDDDDDDDEDDEDFQVDESQMPDDEDDNADVLDPDAVLEAADDSNDDDDDEEEDDKAVRARVLAQRRADEERRFAIEADQQVLKLSLERFNIPEILFCPQNGGLPAHWANLPTAIVQCIEACPEIYRAGLYQSIQLTGGLSKLPHLQQRLERELQSLVHPDYNELLRIRTLPNPLEASWRGGCRLVSTNSYTKWSVSSASGHQSVSSTLSAAAAATTGATKVGAIASPLAPAWRKLLLSEGGYYF
jgi:actin-related protein